MTTLLQLASASAGSSGALVPATLSFFSSTRELSATFWASAWWAGLWIVSLVIFVYGTLLGRVELAGLHADREQVHQRGVDDALAEHAGVDRLLDVGQRVLRAGQLSCGAGAQRVRLAARRAGTVFAGRGVGPGRLDAVAVGGPAGRRPVVAAGDCGRWCRPRRSRR